jgi:acyl carrier protein phosphodiesterase
LRKKQREYLKDKINDLAINSKKKNITGSYRRINEFKENFQNRTNLVKDVNGDMLAHSHTILNRWKNFFSELLNVYRVSVVRQIEIHTAEPIIPERAV